MQHATLSDADWRRLQKELCNEDGYSDSPCLQRGEQSTGLMSELLPPLPHTANVWKLHGNNGVVSSALNPQIGVDL